jgi:hypothetical protein
MSLIAASTFFMSRGAGQLSFCPRSRDTVFCSLRDQPTLEMSDGTEYMKN